MPRPFERNRYVSESESSEGGNTQDSELFTEDESSDQSYKNTNPDSELMSEDDESSDPEVEQAENKSHDSNKENSSPTYRKDIDNASVKEGKPTSLKSQVPRLINPKHSMKSNGSKDAEWLSGDDSSTANDRNTIEDSEVFTDDDSSVHAESIPNDSNSCKGNHNMNSLTNTNVSKEGAKLSSTPSSVDSRWRNTPSKIPVKQTNTTLLPVPKSLLKKISNEPLKVIYKKSGDMNAETDYSSDKCDSEEIHNEDGDVSMASIPSPPRGYSVPLAESSILPNPRSHGMGLSPLKSVADFGRPKSLSHLPRPLAESTILGSGFQKPHVVSSDGQQLKDNIKRQFTTKFLGVPKALLQKESKQDSSIIVLDSSNDSDIIESSFIRDSPDILPLKTPKKEAPPEVVLDSDASSSSPATISNSKSFPPNESTESKPATSTISQTSVDNSATSQSSMASTSSQSEVKRMKRLLEEKLMAYRNLVHAQKNCDPRKLKDGGTLLNAKIKKCEMELEELKKRFNDLSAEIEPEIEIISSKKDIIFSTNDQKTAHLGQKGMETHRIEKALTMDALVNLHSSLAATPSENTMETQPAGLKADLMPHQRKALAWLLYREKQAPAGGILADDMGLGKTLTMISLVMRSAELGDIKPKQSDWVARSGGKKHPGKTLVIAPASLIGQWESQVKEHVKPGVLKIIVHHGNCREGRGSVLANADIVITTYGVVTQENKTKLAVFRVSWERVILDEAHSIRNHKTQSAIAVCELESKCRWCLTGTPVHNKALDMYSLLKFLRCAPFDDIMVWKRWVDNKTPAGTERLNTVVKSILLRRTKEELKAQGGLKNLATKEIHPIRIDLDEEEFKVYENVLNFSKTLVAQYLQQRAEKVEGGLLVPGLDRLKSQLQTVADVKTHDILVLLLRLRQICCLPGLISAMLEEDAAAADGFAKEDEVIEDLYRHVRRLSIREPMPHVEDSPKQEILEKVLLTSNPVFDLKRPSSKMKKIIKVLRKIVDLGDKVVVVSQWASYLRNLAQHLEPLRIKYDTLDGSVPVKNRGPLVERFNDPESSLKILLLTLTAGGVGLNLVGANHLILMEPHWNPQLEAQACDRVYRVGQSKPVHIYKVICQNTIEERIEILQGKKLVLAENVLTGQMKKEITQLSLQDLKSLFGMAPM